MKNSTYSIRELLEIFKNFYSKPVSNNENIEQEVLESQELETAEEQETDIIDIAEVLSRVESNIQLLIESKDKGILNSLKEIGKKLSGLEFLGQERVSHRFDGKKDSYGNGIDYFAHNTAIEETIAFADEVERLCSLGMDRRSAYIQAKNNLQK
ncbi:MAG: hypothetical protein ACRCTQ_05190 [Brevinemataceae bacterium]